MIPGPSCPCRHVPGEPKNRQIEFIDEKVYDPNQVILADPVFQPLRKERCLFLVGPFEETRHACPPYASQKG